MLESAEQVIGGLDCISDPVSPRKPPNGRFYPGRGSRPERALVHLSIAFLQLSDSREELIIVSGAAKPLTPELHRVRHPLPHLGSLIPTPPVHQLLCEPDGL